MTLRLNGTTGYVQLDCAATGGNNTLVLPTGNGSADQALVTNGSGALSWSDRGRMTLATAQASTSGTAIDFTGIPSWVKRVTVMFNGVSTAGTSSVILQVGSGSVEATGYSGSTSLISSAVTTTQITSGWAITPTGGQAAATVLHGSVFITLFGSNVWAVSGAVAKSDSAATNVVAGSKATSGTLDRIRITTVNGTDTFDAGSINILYEG